MEEERYRVRIEGTRPLLMNRYTGEEGKTKRSGERFDPKERCLKALYRDKEGRIVVPARCVKATMVNAAKEFKVPGKRGKTYRDYVRAGIIIEPMDIPLITPNGDPERAWEIDLQPVVIDRGRVMAARPRFDEWALEFDVIIVDPIITPENVKLFLENAGKYVGLLDYRPEYGLFKVTKFEKVE